MRICQKYLHIIAEFLGTLCPHGLHTWLVFNISQIYLLVSFPLLLLLFWFFKKEREKSIDVREKHWSAASYMHSDQWPNPQPRHVPDRGIEPVTFQCTGWRSNHRATLARLLFQWFQAPISIFSDSKLLATPTRWKWTHPSFPGVM